MVQCEMCGAETGAPKTIKVEGAELDVCDSCANLGTEVSQPTSGSTSTKYSTSSSPSSSTSSTRSGSTTTTRSSGRSTSGSRDDDMFDSLGEIAQDYDQRIRNARESRNLSQEELAKELNEKRSLINKLERGEILPNDAIQSKLERYLEIDLTESGAETEEWSSEGTDQSFTLGEVAERKD